MKNLWIFLVVFSSIGGSIFAQNTYKYKVGDMEVILLSENQSEGKPGILIGATPEMIRKTLPDGNFSNAVNAFLVKMPGKNVLIDAGFGNKLFDNLEAFNVTAEQIDIVLLTHMHGDHIGGMMKDKQINFPNADIYIAQQEYDYWMSDDAMNRLPENRRGGFHAPRKVIAAYKDKIHLFPAPDLKDASKEILPGIRGIAAFGHTPGHTMFLLESGKKKMLVWGDLTHAMAIQMPYPQVAVTYDVDPETAVTSRKEVLEYVTKNKIPIAGMHIAFPGMGEVRKEKSGGYRFIPMK
ncbi:MAG: MBL fold metallo-hydrolase [Bacteroidales bacterium]|jgi:glyoxylase-like metal-dependent hydrolase (beta-lactamase superfamily II)|nr:MBL fold metallo-hydrolase [Bacteroidales bacterium]